SNLGSSFAAWDTRHCLLAGRSIGRRSGTLTSHAEAAVISTNASSPRIDRTFEQPVNSYSTGDARSCQLLTPNYSPIYENEQRLRRWKISLPNLFPNERDPSEVDFTSSSRLLILLPDGCTKSIRRVSSYYFV
ncbi:unnamed protein product, partial [Penicillium nalgiovense]